MTSTDRHNPTNAELLALIEQQRIWIEQLQRDMGQRRGAVNTQYRKRSEWATRALTETSVRPSVPVSQSRVATFVRRPLERGKKLGMGLSLALLLLAAPSQGGVTHANNANGNTAYGYFAMFHDTGSGNSVFGSYAFDSNQSGTANTGSGTYTLNNNTTGSYNTASGAYALNSNTMGSFNTASGMDALYDNTTGGDNSASGSAALLSNSTGIENSASGANALYANTTGNNNTALGALAGYTTTSTNANTTGSNNTFIGYNSGPGTSSEITNATAIGANALVSQSNSIVLGGTGDNTQRVGVGTTTPHSALQIARGYLQYRSIVGAPPATACSTDADSGRTVVRTDGPTNLYVCLGAAGWVGK